MSSLSVSVACVTDTGRMWILVRAVALLVLALVGGLLAGHGGWLLDAADRATDGVGPRWLPRDGVDLTWQVAATGLVTGTAATAWRRSRRVLGHLATLLHELAHTLVAAAWGARPAGIVLRHDASGHATARWTDGSGLRRRLGLAATAFAGLPGPAVAAATGAQLLLLAGPRAVLWSLAAAGVLVALLARSVWSLLAPVVLSGLAVAGLTDQGEPWTEGAVVAVLAAVALTSATDAMQQLRLRAPVGEDARAVRDQLRLPSGLVQTTQVVITAAAAGWTVWLLLTGAGIDRLLPA